MKKLLIFLWMITVAGNVIAQQNKIIEASMDKVKLKFMLDPEGRACYAVSFAGKAVIANSHLGIDLLNDTAFDQQLEIIKTETTQVDEQWHPVWGELSTIRNKYEQLVVQLRQKNSPNRLINIIFRVFEDGLGFRYEFPKQPGLRYFIVSDERTEFHLTGDHKTFWIPADYDTNEYKYTTSKLTEVDSWKVTKAATDIAVRVAPDQQGVQTPLMMKSADGLYINIHEAALQDYSAMQLHVDKNTFNLTVSLVPDAVGNKAYLVAPCKTPWRTILVSDHAADLLASKTILNLNEPSVIENTSWIKPMKFVGVWWEMQTGKSTWSYANRSDTLNAKGQLIPNGTHGANTANVKRYIDFAAAHGVQGVLVEGWNIGWEDWFGNWKEKVFDFVKAYPDYDVDEVTAYAASKGVKMIMHNETSGAATDYERQLDTAYRFMNKFGFPAVKTGYVGKIIPRGEHHDGQWMVDHYIRVLEKAAEHQVMVDVHEAVRPTGLHRTYPNFMASEAGRGNEYNAFSDGNPPEHETILPFTRLMGGPMDYTPGIFKLKGYSSVSGRQVHTTLAKQLALYVTLYSPVQMVADQVENYDAHMDAFQFIKDVPVDWDDTKIVEAEPGDYITIARKEKGKDNWFLGAVTDENARKTKIGLNFLDKGRKYVATVYADAEYADWQENPEAYTIHQYIVTSVTKLKLNLAKGGGAAVSFMPFVKGVGTFKKYK
ncbi:Alpha-glucosidase SusB [Arcticibacter svalbardensis MN12-7]|uniref:Alpha-glucosidase SusB n=1 Tax=Arcticibacter svalbardensis MN12-7 TaxID=1150600 RepID=R9GVV4_9SPHI|nr:glycoside hydrolase family 97 protein [Arcticibacter svalbardensis]EOR95972.1 Alpha-glucosidase SusB [Arcticibacter svalbardensis MN12-7]